MDITLFEVTVATVTAVVIGLTQVLKTIGLPKRLVPIVVLAVAVILTVIAAFFANTASVILTGLVIGLSSMGLWSGTKTTLGK